MKVKEEEEEKEHICGARLACVVAAHTATYSCNLIGQLLPGLGSGHCVHPLSKGSSHHPFESVEELVGFVKNLSKRSDGFTQRMFVEPATNIRPEPTSRRAGKQTHKQHVSSVQTARRKMLSVSTLLSSFFFIDCVAQGKGRSSSNSTSGKRICTPRCTMHHAPSTCEEHLQRQVTAHGRYDACAIEEFVGI